MECPRACEVSDWTEWSKYACHITEMTNQKVTCEQIETVVTKGDCLMCESQVPGHVPEGSRRSRGFVDGNSEEGAGHSCYPCSWRPGWAKSVSLEIIMFSLFM